MDEVDLAYQILSEAGNPIHFKKLIREIIKRKNKVVQNEAAAISEIYTMINSDGRFQHVKDGLWGLTDWYLPKKRTRKRNDNGNGGQSTSNNKKTSIGSGTGGGGGNITSPSGTPGDSGTCGYNLTWEFYRGGTLIISGNGLMENYSRNNRPPYYNKYHDKIKKVIVTKGVTSIGDYAFADCENLKKVIYSSTVKSVSLSAFENCPSLKIYYVEGNGNGLERTNDDFVPYDGDCEKDCVTVIGGTICLEKEVIITGHSSIKKIFLLIADKPVARTIIDRINSSGGVYFDLDSDLEEIDDEAYKDCLGFKDVNLGDYKKCRRIGKRAFAGCVNMKFVILPPNLEEIDNGAFEGCTSLAEVKNSPKSLKRIGERAFKNCESLASFKLPKNLREICAETFADCKSLKEIAIPEDVIGIGVAAFAYCESLKIIKIPASVEEIGTGVFYGCNEIEEIHYRAGSGFESMLSFGNNAKLILYDREHEVWELLPSLDEFDDDDVEDDELIDPPDPLLLSGTCGKNLTWQLINGTLTISGTSDMENFSYDNESPYYDKRDLIQTVIVEAGVTTIGEHAFHGCKNLTNVQLPDTLRIIGASAFCGCEKLTAIKLPDGLTFIGNNAFNNSKLESITIPASVITIEPFAFGSCYNSLKSVEILGSLNEIARGTFRSCYKLKSVKIHGTVKTICDGTYGHGAFQMCKKLESLDQILKDGVEKIGNYTFRWCENLTSVTLPPSVTSIGKDIFYGCEKLKTIRYKRGLKSANKLTSGNTAKLRPY